MLKIRVMSERDDVRDIPGFELYAITDDGQVWSVKGRGVQLIAHTPRRLKTKWHHGFPSVELFQNNVDYPMGIARLLALTFISPPPFDGAQGIFIDGDPHHQTPGNVRWDTSSGRTLNTIRRLGPPVYGETQGGHKLTEANVIDIRARHQAGETIKALMERYEVSRKTIQRVLRRKLWKQTAGECSPVRFAKGEQIGNAKLSEQGVRRIRALAETGMTQTALSEQFHVSVSTIHQIIHNKTWRHVS